MSNQMWAKQRNMPLEEREILWEKGENPGYFETALGPQYFIKVLPPSLKVQDLLQS